MKSRVFTVTRLSALHERPELQSSDVKGEAVTAITYRPTISIMAGYNCLNKYRISSFRFMVDIILLKIVSLLYICTR